jgi:NAD(P) transhydrogenase
LVTPFVSHRPIPAAAVRLATATTTTHLNAHPVQYDLAIIGAGPVGVQAALVAAASPFNKKVCLIDAPRASGMLMNEATGEDLSIGGPTGLFSKALRDTSKHIRVSALRGMGLREESVWNEIICNCVDLASSNAQDVMRQLEFAGVDYVKGFASFPDGGTTSSLAVANDDNKSMQTIHATNILVGTGSKPFRPGGIPFDGVRVFDSDSINQISYLPKSIAITGSGIIAIEFAKIFRNLGAEVTLIIRDKSPRNALSKIGLDKDVSALLVADLVRSGIRIERGAQVKEFDVPVNNPQAPIRLLLEGKGGQALPRGQEAEVKCDAYLAAVGRIPNTANLNLLGAGIKVDEYGGILVDSNLCATAKAQNVYAAGDVLGRPFLASTGVAQGIGAVAAMFGQPGKGSVSKCDPDDLLCIDGDISAAGASFDPGSLASNPFAFPCGVWTSPEASYFGLSTQQAKEFGIDAAEGIALYAECLRGRVFSPNGLLKLVFEKPSGRILGVHIVGDDGTFHCFINLLYNDIVACNLIHSPHTLFLVVIIL